MSTANKLQSGGGSSGATHTSKYAMFERSPSLGVKRGSRRRSSRYNAEGSR